jgi:hypothetical protein
MTPEKREKLIARTCRLILTEGQFDMSIFTGVGPQRPTKAAVRRARRLIRKHFPA